MLHESENLMLVFHNDSSYKLVRDADECLGFFGGPLEYKIAGRRYGPRRLHQIASLLSRFLRELGRRDDYTEIPLIYGMCYDGCRLKYHYDGNKVTILEMSPTKSSEGWPYDDYPAMLPY